MDAGDVFAIPLEDSRWALAQVLFCSRHYKDCVLIGVESRLHNECPDLADSDTEFDGLNVWTSSVSAARYWQSIGTAPLPKDHLERTRRVVGGGVWLGDDFLHPASREEMSALPKMRAYGNVALVREIAQLLGDRPTPANTA